MNALRMTLMTLAAIAGVAILPACASAADPPWPARVLITNDNGIEDARLVELARRVSAFAETYVVAATADRSGRSNLMTAVRSGRFQVAPRDFGPGITAYALDGDPADCVVFAVAGPMRDRLPDLVISGINGGPNLGDDWFGSGTIGAARTAAFLGFPAIAVSGLDDDDRDAVRAAVEWVAQLVRSEAVRALRAPQYLTVSLPVTPPAEIDGVVVAERAHALVTGAATPTGDTSTGRQTWELKVEVQTDKATAGSDVVAVTRGSIAVVPMRVDESDPAMAEWLRARPGALPEWRPPAPAGAKHGKDAPRDR